jgi:hypothetical protein
MYEVVHKGKVLFRSASLDRCKQFKLRHKLSGAVIQPMEAMLAA